MGMSQKDLSEYKRKYDIFRHHAWAGTALLSVLLAVRYLIASLPRYIFIPLFSILIVYILIALLFTYKYRAGLSRIEESHHVSEQLEREKTQAQVEKKRFKLEKKKAKTKAKQEKKG
jgi:MFS superfamily sulfate permease-like transporter